VDKVIVTVMLIIGGLVASFAVFNTVYPAAERSGQAVSDAANSENNRITSQIEIIQVGITGNIVVDAWAKNVGTSSIGSIPNSDVFFGAEGETSRISYGDISSPLPYWSYQLEGSQTTWQQTVTNKISIHLAQSLAAGTYVLKVVIPNGVYDQTSFSVE
jgi:hypothetical protein